MRINPVSSTILHSIRFIDTLNEWALKKERLPISEPLFFSFIWIYFLMHRIYFPFYRKYFLFRSKYFPMARNYFPTHFFYQAILFFLYQKHIKAPTPEVRSRRFPCSMKENADGEPNRASLASLSKAPNNCMLCCRWTNKAPPGYFLYKEPPPAQLFRQSISGRFHRFQPFPLISTETAIVDSLALRQASRIRILRMVESAVIASGEPLKTADEKCSTSRR